MVDPDAPERVGDGAGQFGPWLHWLVTDAKLSADKGNTGVSYMGPSPPKGTHRYIFVLFRQPSAVKVHSTERKKWDFGKFLSDNPELEPVAVNFYYCES